MIYVHTQSTMVQDTIFRWLNQPQNLLVYSYESF